MPKHPNFKYAVEGEHPIFKRVDRRCFSWAEAKNVESGLLAVGYKVEIIKITKLQQEE